MELLPESEWLTFWIARKTKGYKQFTQKYQAKICGYMSVQLTPDYATDIRVNSAFFVILLLTIFRSFVLLKTTAYNA
jgi:hypothetical protein